MHLVGAALFAVPALAWAVLAHLYLTYLAYLPLPGRIFHLFPLACGLVALFYLTHSVIELLWPDLLGNAPLLVLLAMAGTLASIAAAPVLRHLLVAVLGAFAGDPPLSRAWRAANYGSGILAAALSFLPLVHPGPDVPVTLGTSARIAGEYFLAMAALTAYELHCTRAFHRGPLRRGTLLGQLTTTYRLRAGEVLAMNVDALQRLVSP